MKLDVVPLRCFLAVADCGSFSQAAKQLNLSQPAVTSNVRSLEDSLNLKLFERSTRAVSLTPTGVDLAGYARKALKELDGFKAAARGIEQSQAKVLRLGSAIYSQDFLERIRLVDGFAETYSDTAFQVDFSFQEALKPRLESGDLDVALMIVFPVGRSAYLKAMESPDAAELLVPDDWPRIALRRRPVLLGVPQSSELAQLERIRRSDMAGLSIVVPSADHGTPFSNHLREVLLSGGAQLITPPEGNCPGVERYGTRRRLPTITLGWFSPKPGQMDDMVALPVEGLDLETEFAAVFSPEGLSPGAAQFKKHIESQDWLDT